MNKQPDILLEPASSQAKIIMLALTVGLPFFLTCLAFAFAAAKNQSVKSLVANSLPITIVIVLLAEILLTTALWYFLSLAMNRHRIEWQRDDFSVLTSFYKQHYLRGDLLLDAAIIVNLENDKEHRPFLKTNGYAVPGFRSGWFRLRNRQSAFCALGPGKRVLMIPTQKGHYLMLGTKAPEQALEQLRAWAIEA
ncbi:MAG: hypothetical protein ABIP02_10225 [Arenimonas sp.]